MLKKLLIFPYNGNGIEALNCIGNQYEFIGFIDDVKIKQGRTSSDYTVYSRDAFDRYPEAKILAVPGNPRNFKERKEVIDGLKINYNRFANLIHPNAVISPLAEIGYNLLIMSGVVVTSNSEIGNHVCVLPNTVIHHDTKIGSYTLIGSNVSIAGHSVIGNNCYIGSGSSIIDNIRLGSKCLVGMGSNVIKSVKRDSRVAGNPARYI